MLMLIPITAESKAGDGVRFYLRTQSAAPPPAWLKLLRRATRAAPPALMCAGTIEGTAEFFQKPSPSGRHFPVTVAVACMCAARGWLSR